MDQERYTDAGIISTLLEEAYRGRELARLARNRTLSPSLRAYADRMDEDLRVIEDGLDDLAGGLDLELEVEREEVRDEVRKEMAQLLELDEQGFEEAFYRKSIAYHVKLLGWINREFLPDAQAAALKLELENIRGALARHRRNAESNLKSNLL